MAAAADQLGASLERDRLLRDATLAEIIPPKPRPQVRRGCPYSVSAWTCGRPSPRSCAAAGSLMDPEVDCRSSSAACTAGVRRPGGRVAQPARHEPPGHEPVRRGRAAPRPARDVRPSLLWGRMSFGEPPQTGRWFRSSTDIPEDLPLVKPVDGGFLSQTLANIIDNAAKYAGPEVPSRVRSTPPSPTSSRSSGLRSSESWARRAGRGAPAPVREVLPRAASKGEGSRRGTRRIGLWFVRGLAEAMGATVVARQSDLGGLAVDLRVAAVPRDVTLPGPRRPCPSTEGGGLHPHRGGRRGRRAAPVATLFRAGTATWSPEAGDAESATAVLGPLTDRMSSCWTWASRTAMALALIRQVRREATTPILVISARGREEEKYCRARRPRR